MSQTQPDTVPVPASQLTLTGHPLDQAPAHVDQLHPGTMVGPYRLLRPLGHGGMGEVWLAEQTAPLKREVAIKMLARRINDRMAEAWFLVERQALAMLVHPYIAQIYDAGQLPGGGAMFFAMEYIEGTTLDRWVNGRKPSLTEVAELLERICSGMQHAHQRGLIHRDLKPANLLVRDDGQVPLPKIIDFGVAVGGVPGQQVQIDQKVTIGTAAYMAPEQSRPTAEGIDARVDVYALGATLANILCSRAGLEIEVKHALSHVAASLTRTGINPAEHVPTKPALHALRKSIPKELRAIAVKAMAADREQRYESAAALGADLQRWRLGQPVLAMGGGRAYAVSCFLRRYRWASAAAAVALLALVVGIGAALFGLGQARHAQSVAEQRRVQAENLVEVMLGDLADNLRPLGKLDLLETVGEEAMRYLSEADKTDGQAAGAVTRARALITLGEVYLARSQQQKASVAFAQSAQVLDHADTEREERRALDQEKARTAYFLGYLAFLAGDYALAERHWLRRSELSEQLQQSESNEATILESAQALHNLATLALQQGQTDLALGRFERSVALKRQAFALSPSGDDARFALANSLSSIGTTLQAQGQPGQALRYFQQQVALLADVTADDHSISWQDRIGVAKRLQGRLEFDLSGDDDGLLAAAVNHLQAAAEADPNNRVNARSLLAAQSDLAWTRFLGGEADAGLSYLQSAIEGYRRPGESEFDNPTLSTLVRAYTRLTLIAAVTSNDRYWELATAQLQMLLEAAPEGWTESGFGYSELACRDLAAALRANGPDQLQQRRDLAEQALLRLGELAQMTELSPISLYALAAKLLGDEEQVDAALRRIESLGYDAAATRRLLTQD